ncbi:hypothetical protein ACFOPG_34120, partial [Couchioplanes caeruleus subsp. azureus]
ALGRFDEAMDSVRASDTRDLTQCQLAVVETLVERGETDRAEELAASVTDRETAARAYALIAVAEPELGRARRLTALCLQHGGWASALPALLACLPEAVPLLADEARALKTACRDAPVTPTAARTCAPSGC